MDSIKEKLRQHVKSRNGPVLENGAWQLMLDAADELDRLEEEVESLDGMLLDQNFQ